MNKQELIEKIAEDTGLNKAQSQQALESTLSAITGALTRGDRVTLVGFGNFDISERKATTGRNPQTGEAIQIAAKKRVKFKAGKQLDEVVNDKKAA